MAAHAVHGRRPDLLLQRLAGRIQAAALHDPRRAQRLQVLGLFGPPGAGVHLETQARQQGHGNAAHAAIGPRHQHGAAGGRDAMRLQRHHAQHGRIAGRAYGHGIPCAEGLGPADQPVAVHPRLLGEPAPVGLAHAPSVEQHGIAGLETRVLAVQHRAGQVDARHHGELAHHGRAPRDGQCILVVERGMRDGHAHRAGGQAGFVQLHTLGTGFTRYGLGQQQGFEHGVSSKAVAKESKGNQDCSAPSTPLRHRQAMASSAIPSSRSSARLPSPRTGAGAPGRGSASIHRNPSPGVSTAAPPAP